MFSPAVEMLSLKRPERGSRRERGVDSLFYFTGSQRLKEERKKEAGTENVFIRQQEKV